jgi:hypothetical protein
LLAQFFFDLFEAGVWVRIVPVFHALVHRLSRLQKLDLPLRAGFLAGHAALLRHILVKAV